MPRSSTCICTECTLLAPTHSSSNPQTTCLAAAPAPNAAHTHVRHCENEASCEHAFTHTTPPKGAPRRLSAANMFHNIIVATNTTTIFACDCKGMGAGGGVFELCMRRYHHIRTGRGKRLYPMAARPGPSLRARAQQGDKTFSQGPFERVFKYIMEVMRSARSWFSSIAKTGAQSFRAQLNASPGN